MPPRSYASQGGRISIRSSNRDQENLPVMRFSSIIYGRQRPKRWDTTDAAEEIIGEHVSRLYPPEAPTAGKPEEELREAEASGHVEEQGWRVRKDGSRFWAEVVTTALRDPDGKLVGFVKMDKDITARREAEEQIQMLNKELSQRVFELGTANKELESFSHSVSHDLRAPLRHVDGFTRILKEEFAEGIPADGSSASTAAFFMFTANSMSAPPSASIFRSVRRR